MKAGLRTFLLADANISAAISGLYSFPAPQRASYTTKPYLMLSRLDESNQRLITGELDVYDETWQIDIIAATDKVAETVKELIITRMQAGCRVAMGSYWVYSCHLLAVSDGSELEDFGGESSINRKILTYQFKRNRDSE